MKGWWLAIPVSAWLVTRTCRHDPADFPEHVRFATFNIEDFPKDRRQIDGAFSEIGSLGVGFVAVQEIGDPELFGREARITLGAEWKFVHINVGPLDAAAHPAHHIGVLFDRRVWTLVSAAAHDETRLERGRHKPTLEVRLRPAGGGDILRVLVVHLKAGGDGRDIRARQYVALAQIVTDAKRSHERIVLLGDFNATGDGDRADLEQLARDTEMTWATRDLACSAFWSRDDGCPRSRLDHVLTWAPPATVEAAGACATDGCDWQDRCPLYAEQVSDHCPVVVAF